MKYFVVILIIANIFCNYSCNKDDNTTCAKKGIIRDLIGVNNCSIVIEADNKEMFEPVNWSDFPITIYNGMQVNFSYSPVAKQSTCLTATAVSLNCLRQI